MTADDLLDLPPTELFARAAELRDRYTGTRITYSPKVFIPLTMLCRDRCGYCTFAKAPARLTSPYLVPDEVLAIARAALPAGGGMAGCPRLWVHGGLPDRHVPPRPGGNRSAAPRQCRGALSRG